MAPKFGFYEIVLVRHHESRGRSITGMEGIVLGMAEDSDGWGYAVFITQLGVVYDLSEAELQPTGRFSRREDIYDGTSVRVLVDPDTGEGTIA